VGWDNVEKCGNAFHQMENEVSKWNVQNTNIENRPLKKFLFLIARCNNPSKNHENKEKGVCLSKIFG